MLTSDDLARDLVGLDLDLVAARSGVVKKTLQRLIARTSEPKLNTANRVYAAITTLRAEEALRSKQRAA